jgi:hypothetical protein
VLGASQPQYEEAYGVKYDVSFSVQKPSTDTVAVNPDNTPFRTDEGELLFRPAGHGALIENLNDIDADVIFVKNIDNVTTDARRGDTVKYKKALAGLLLEIKGEFPKLHEKMEYEHYQFEVLEMDARRILKVKVIIGDSNK